MYERLAEKEKADLRARYEKTQEYMVAYNAINVVSEQYEDLSPEEIWSEALLVVDEISKANRREWKVDKVYSQLKRRYSAFKSEDGSIEKRTGKQQDKTATMVLFDVVLMLTLAQKVDAEKAEEHPYYQYISTILGHIGETVLFAAMLAVMRRDEEAIEQMMGKELEQMDYMDGVPEPVSEPKDMNTKLMDDKVRRAKLLRVKNELERQLGDKFKGGSQWFYVYKLLAEMHIYADRSYVLFEADMNEIKVQVNTNTFTRKYAQLKENTTYPYWKPATGCKTATVEEGKRIAGIAYDIMNK